MTKGAEGCMVTKGSGGVLNEYAFAEAKRIVMVA